MNINIKETLANLKALTSHELKVLRHQVKAMPWSFESATAGTLIQVEIERRAATQKPALYAASWAVIGTAAYVSYDIADWTLENLV